MLKSLNRDPAVLSGVVAALLAFLLTFDGLDLNAEKVGAIMAVVTFALGVWTAWKTRDTALGLLVGGAKAIICLFAAYSLPLSADKTGALIGLITVGVAFYQRTQTSPLLTPSFSNDSTAATI